MRLTRLRIAGFKTFVEPTDVPIEPGLTGIVGPNGCGKSNLVEALRWVMGESSHKNMRASGMDEVIFGGSATRPARNTAEVTLAIDNSDRRAPAAFNDADALEVSRRIERARGSSYHVNGREVRARDVQLLFADAATGARSPAMVRQGQIAELIGVRPQARRRILEDAAGIAGLHTRRHEAELRLKAAEDNLLRVEDILREIEDQAEGLRRQGRQAARYRTLSAEIRKLEAQLAAAAWRDADRERQEGEAAMRKDVRAVAERTAEQAEAARAQAVAAHEIGPLREAEIAAAAALRRLTEARGELEHEERRAAERSTELARRMEELERDAARQRQVGADAAETLARLAAEDAELAGAAEAARTRRAETETELAESERELALAEAALGSLQAELAELAARKAALGREQAAERERADRQHRDAERLRAELAALEASRAGAGPDPLRPALEAAQETARAAEAAALEARLALAAAREREAPARKAADEAERTAQRLETEFRTLAKLFASGGGKRFTTMLDAVSVEPGWESALAAALGEDLDASSDPAAPLRWQDTGPGDDDPDLPEGARSLSEVVQGPPALLRRLRQTGTISRVDAALLAPRLRPGQRLVSPEGDLWRWDGLVAAADAPSAAARRLAERNRLTSLEGAAGQARRTADEAGRLAAAAQDEVCDAASRENASVEAGGRARRALDGAREALARAERRDREVGTRHAAVTDAVGRVEAAEREARERAEEAGRLLAATAVPAKLEERHRDAGAAAAARRAAVAEGRATLAASTREAEADERRRAALAAERTSWNERAARAVAAGEELAERLRVAGAERAQLAAAPNAFALRRRALASQIAQSETRRSEAADGLAVAERRLAEADRLARTALDTLAAARERRAASQAREEALSRRAAEMARAIAETFDKAPSALLAECGLAEGKAFDPAAAETRLDSLKGDRERLGAVNLRAEDELAEAEGKRDRLAGERDDLGEAIKRLRQAIASLNREGRERLLAAFGTVNAQFGRLFTTLFGGGEAELNLTESDDPLEAGLDITARPPGKRPQSLSLLSGGEQALTATALIFAVFLTNPSPICVLDEVDAPLDDANVERFCDLLHDMAGETDTRFVAITHNPITMARMNRLFGVTMAERGISQLVSVDLGTAEGMREAV